MTFWDYERAIVQLVILFMLFRIGKVLRQLLERGVSDRAAREEEIQDLKETAVKLAEKTESLMHEAEARGEAAGRASHAAETLEKIESNTRQTVDVLKEKDGTL